MKGTNKQERPEIRIKWDDDIEAGTLDLTKVYWADEKVFSPGACRGNKHNLVVWVKNTLQKAELPNDLIMRDDGEYQGGASVMVLLGVSYQGKGTLRFAPAGT